MRDALHMHGTSVAAAALPSLLRPLSLPPALAVHLKEDVFWEAGPHADPAKGGKFNKQKNSISVKHILLETECPITTVISEKNGYDFNASNNVRDILYNTDIINSIVKLIVHSPVGKLVQFFLNFFLCVCVCVLGFLFCWSHITSM